MRQLHDRSAIHDRPAPSEEEELSFARAAAFFITLAIVAVLALVGSAQAAPSSLSAPLASASAEEEEMGEEAVELEAEEGEEEEPCVEEELDDGEWEICEDEAGASSGAECIVTSATATVTAAAEPGKLRLAVRYRSVAPALVSVAYRLRGGKGSLSLGQERARFGREGVFRDTATLAEEEMEKVLAAKEFTVELYAANSPRHCRDQLERHLTARKAVPGGMFWAAPSARQGRP